MGVTRSRAIAIGAVTGLVQSIAPFELLILVFFPIWVVMFAGFAGRAWRARSFAPMGGPVAMPVAFVLTVGAAWLAPLKYDDRTRLALPAECVDVETIVRLSRATWYGSPPPAEPICFDSRTPSRSTVRLALASRGIAWEQSYCGNGSTVLFGGFPMRTRLALSTD